MASCKKCDRCKTFYEHYGREDYSEPVHHYNGMANAMCFCFETSVEGNVYNKTMRDLCPSCLDDLIHFMNGADIVSAIRTTEDKNNG